MTDRVWWVSHRCKYYENYEKSCAAKGYNIDWRSKELCSLGDDICLNPTKLENENWVKVAEKSSSAKNTYWKLGPENVQEDSWGWKQANLYCKQLHNTGRLAEARTSDMIMEFTARIPVSRSDSAFWLGAKSNKFSDCEKSQDSYRWQSDNSIVKYGNSFIRDAYICYIL